MTHTPGPWVVSTKSGPLSNKGFTDPPAIRDSSGEYLAILLAALKALMAATRANSRWCPACNCNVNLEHKEHLEPCSWVQAEAAIAKVEVLPCAN